MQTRFLALVLSFLLSSIASAATVTEATTLVSYGSKWSFWLDDGPPPGWPLAGGPGAADNILRFLPEALPESKTTVVLQASAASDPDRVLPINNGRGGLLTSGSWWNGFSAPFAARSEQRWHRYHSSWAKDKRRNRKKKRSAYSRTNLVYPTDIAATAKAPSYSSTAPEPGPAAMYFAKRFQVKDASSVVDLRLQARFKKGVQIFINGQPVGHDRIAQGAEYGTYGYQPKAKKRWIRNTIRGSDRWEHQWLGVNPSMLKTGTNVITAVVHKTASAGSPSLYFDVQLKAHTRVGFVKTPWLHGVHKHGLTVSWETTAKTHGKVILTDESGSSVGEFKSAKLGVHHEVPLTGLNPNTRYFYATSSYTPKGQRGTSVRSSPLSFVTAPTDGSPFSFLLYGDTRWGVHIHKPFAEMMVADADKYGANLVIHTGDLVTKGNEWDLWQERFFKPASPLISRVPIMPVPGNHELNAELYYDYFNLPNNEAWYHFRYGMADFYGVNTNVGFSPKSSQYKWLDEQLSKNTGRWKIVFMHHPPFACSVARKPGNKNVIRDLVPLFEKHGVHLVLLGHDHLYGRSRDINGVHYIISGGAGSYLYKCRPDEKMVVCERKYNYVRFKVGESKINWTAFDKAGGIIEEYSIGN
jgi:hypothetical protein